MAMSPNEDIYVKNYTDKINAYIRNKLIKVLIGQRRVGKSYLLRQIVNQLIKNLGKSEKYIICQ